MVAAVSSLQGGYGSGSRGEEHKHAGAIRQPFPDMCMALSMVWYLTPTDASSGGTCGLCPPLRVPGVSSGAAAAVAAAAAGPPSPPSVAVAVVQNNLLLSGVDASFDGC